MSYTTFGNFALGMNNQTWNTNFNTGWNTNWNTDINSAWTIPPSQPFLTTSAQTKSSIVQTQEKSTNTAEDNTEEQDRPLTQKELTAIWEKGENVFNRIHKWSNKEDYKNIIKDLDSINKDNIIAFMTGYYETKADKTILQHSPEGIIEALDDEVAKGGAIPMETKLKLVKALIEVAKENGLHEMPKLNKNIEELEKIYELYTTGELKDSKTFEHNRKICWDKRMFGSILVTGSCISPFVSDHETDDERIDINMKAIYDALAGIQG